MLLDQNNSSLFLHALSLVVHDNYLEEGRKTIPSSRVAPLLKIEKRSITKLQEKPVTSVDLSVQSLKLISQNRQDWDNLLFFQSYPDFDAMTAPMQKAVQYSSLKFKQMMGFTHILPDAALEMLKVGSWAIPKNEEALLLFTEQTIFEEDQKQNYSIALHVSKKEGPVKIDLIEENEESRRISYSRSLNFWKDLYLKLENSTGKNNFLVTGITNSSQLATFSFYIECRPTLSFSSYRSTNV